MKAFSDQKGFTLVELMIAMVIGIIVSAAVIAAFLTVLSSNSDNMKTVRMNEELRAAMALMTRELRTGGAWVRANDNLGTPNPFTAAIEVNNLDASSVERLGNCITFSYDKDGDASFTKADVDDLAPATTDRFGFRLNRDKIEYSANTAITAGAGCNNGTWQAITDPEITKITGLAFTVRPNLPGSPNLFYDIDITVTGIRNLRGSNASVSAGDVDNFNVIERSLSKTIRVRNG